MQTFFQSFVAALSLGGKMMQMKLSVWSFFFSLPLCLCQGPSVRNVVPILCLYFCPMYVGACKNLIILECNIMLAKYLTVFELCV